VPYEEDGALYVDLYTSGEEFLAGYQIKNTCFYKYANFSLKEVGGLMIQIEN